MHSNVVHRSTGKLSALRWWACWRGYGMKEMWIFTVINTRRMKSKELKVQRKGLLTGA